MTGAQVLAQVDPEKVTPGLLGFVVILAIGLATWGLLRSMNHQLKKIDLEPPAAPGRDDAVDVTTDDVPPGGRPDAPGRGPQRHHPDRGPQRRPDRGAQRRPDRGAQGTSDTRS